MEAASQDPNPADAGAGTDDVHHKIGALTGWCPTQLLRSREEPAPVNTLGYDEARQPIDIHSRP